MKILAKMVDFRSEQKAVAGCVFTLGILMAVLAVSMESHLYILLGEIL